MSKEEVVWKERLNEKFNKWTFLDIVDMPSNVSEKTRQRGDLYGLFECECGKQKVIRVKSVVYGTSKSCGHRETKDGNIMINDKGFYDAYKSVVRYFKDKPYTMKYLSKGIKFDWDSYEDFYQDMYESYQLAIENGESVKLDRINDELNFNKDNCTWKPKSKRLESVEVDGQEFSSFKKISDLYNVPLRTIYARYERGLRGSDLIAK